MDGVLEAQSKSSIGRWVLPQRDPESQGTGQRERNVQIKLTLQGTQASTETDASFIALK